MKKEELCEVLGDMNEKYVKEARENRTKKPAWHKWSIIAACLCVVLVLGALYQRIKPSDFIVMTSEQAMSTVAVFTHVDIGDRGACYYRISIDEKKLENYVGKQYLRTETDAWFYPAEVNNLKYLINQSNTRELSLWKFSNFLVSEKETYTYGDVMKLIYGVDSAESIVSITTTPNKANNTDLGMHIQKEVGTHTYTERKDIDTFYHIARNVICYGADSEPRGNENRFTYSFSTNEEDKLTSGESTYATRNLSVKLTDGTTIDNWKYDALSGCFFEYGGVFTEPLAEEEVYQLNDIFGIK